MSNLRCWCQKSWSKYGVDGDVDENQKQCCRCPTSCVADNGENRNRSGTRQASRTQGSFSRFMMMVMTVMIMLTTTTMMMMVMVMVMPEESETRQRTSAVGDGGAEHTGSKFLALWRTLSSWWQGWFFFDVMEGQHGSGQAGESVLA